MVTGISPDDYNWLIDERDAARKDAASWEEVARIHARAHYAERDHVERLRDALQEIMDADPGARYWIAQEALQIKGCDCWIGGAPTLHEPACPKHQTEED